jgi:hypothetical protein
MRLAISNLRLHMTVPELISVPSPSQRVCPAIHLAVSLSLLGSVPTRLSPSLAGANPARPVLATPDLSALQRQPVINCWFSFPPHLMATCLYSFFARTSVVTIIINDCCTLVSLPRASSVLHPPVNDRPAVSPLLACMHFMSSCAPIKLEAVSSAWHALPSFKSSNQRAAKCRHYSLLKFPDSHPSLPLE